MRRVLSVVVIVGACGGGHGSGSPDAEIPSIDATTPRFPDADVPDAPLDAPVAVADAMPPWPDAALPDAKPPDAALSDATPPDAGGPYPAFTLDPPLAISLGGPVLVAPHLVPVFFADDDSQIEAAAVSLLGKLPGSSYWTTTTSEYGVGDVSVADAVVLGENALATPTDGDIQTWLAGAISASTLPAPDANTVYVLFFPQSAQITLGTRQSCYDFGGYHNDVIVGSQDVAYAVLPVCADFGMPVLDEVTSSLSHEVVEAATDPLATNDPAFYLVDDNHFYWEYLLGGGEVADLCAQYSESFFSSTELGAVVQRSWSNASALAGHDPCVPVGIVPYFNAMPVLSPVTVTVGTWTGPTEGVQIATGASQTIDVKLFSDGSVPGPWTVAAKDASFGTPQLGFSWDKTSGVNGDTLHLTITVLSALKPAGHGFYIESTLGATKTVWFGLVTN